MASRIFNTYFSHRRSNSRILNLPAERAITQFQLAVRLVILALLIPNIRFGSDPGGDRLGLDSEQPGQADQLQDSFP